jgi:hypothetical protein
MQAFGYFNPCPPFVKARERLLQLALRNVDRSYARFEEVRRLTRLVIDYVFVDSRDWFTYERVLVAKLFIKGIDRSYIEEIHDQILSKALTCYQNVTGEDLLALPRVREFAEESAANRCTMRSTLGTVAMAWQYICNGSFDPETADDGWFDDDEDAHYPDRV